MRKNTKKAVCILFAVLLLVCSFPISAFAVDPVSGAVIANSFAQAITAYGASHGVSMTFDGITSGNAAQIGQSVHDLWARFRAGQQTADDYDTIAAAVFPGLYNKVIKAGGAAVVGMSIAQEYMEDIDGFWNWLLSGPAEMVKVDNAYQWNVVNGEIPEKPVFNYLDTHISVVSSTDTSAVKWAKGTKIMRRAYSGAYNQMWTASALTDDVYAFFIGGSNYALVLVSPNRTTAYDMYRVINSDNTYSDTYGGASQNFSSRHAETNLYYATHDRLGTPVETYIPVYSSFDSGMLAIGGLINDNPSLISVQPYVGDSVARPVPIPDTDDPDYGPLPWVGDLDIPWNDTLFGDGTGALTDAQKDAISGALDQAIEDDGTLVLEGDEAADNPGTDTDDPPSSDPDDYGVIGLENIFPFCIPFDIYNFLSALAATPTAPHFTATLQLPSALGGAQTIDLDFDNPTFNQLAQLLRLLELLAFIVGLALLTRSMFIRG